MATRQSWRTAGIWQESQILEALFLSGNQQTLAGWTRIRRRDTAARRKRVPTMIHGFSSRIVPCLPAHDWATSAPLFPLRSIPWSKACSNCPHKPQIYLQMGPSSFSLSKAQAPVVPRVAHSWTRKTRTERSVNASLISWTDLVSVNTGNMFFWKLWKLFSKVWNIFISVDGSPTSRQARIHLVLPSQPYLRMHYAKCAGVAPVEERTSLLTVMHFWMPTIRGIPDASFQMSDGNLEKVPFHLPLCTQISQHLLSVPPATFLETHGHKYHCLRNQCLQDLNWLIVCVHASMKAVRKQTCYNHANYWQLSYKSTLQWTELILRLISSLCWTEKIKIHLAAPFHSRVRLWHLRAWTHSLEASSWFSSHDQAKMKSQIKYRSQRRIQNLVHRGQPQEGSQLWKIYSKEQILWGKFRGSPSRIRPWICLICNNVQTTVLGQLVCGWQSEQKTSQSEPQQESPERRIALWKRKLKQREQYRLHEIPLHCQCQSTHPQKGFILDKKV